MDGGHSEEAPYKLGTNELRRRGHFFYKRRAGRKERSFLVESESWSRITRRSRRRK